MYVVTYQNVSATGQEIIAEIIEIRSNSTNGPDLENQDRFGTSVTSIGDLNGDGIPDIAVGAHSDDTGGNDKGGIHVMFMNRNGSASSITKINSKTVNGPELRESDYFGSSIADIGDLNGDGISDIAVGAYGDDTGSINSGAVHLMFMNSDGSVSRTVVINDNTINGPELRESDYFGAAIAGIGDLNDDNTPDIVVGAHFDDGNGTNRGAAHVMFMNSDGSVSRTVEINDNTINGPDLKDTDHFGSSIASIGDLNGDGISDIVVGAYTDNTGGLQKGAVHVMFMNNNGSVSRTVVINDNTINGPDLIWGDNFGSSVANIGDLNDDGISDIAVGAHGDNTGGDNKGAVHVMFMNSNGSVSRTVVINDNTINGPDLILGDTFGTSITNIGYLNNDAVSDIAIGAQRDDAGGINRGAIHVLYMSNIDENPPVIDSIISDARTTGTLKVNDVILFTLTTSSDENFATINSTYNSVELFWSSVDGGTTYTADYTISEGDEDQATPLQIKNVIIADGVGNTSLPFNGTDILQTIDANSPRIVNAQTISNTQIGIMLDHNITDSFAIPVDFTLDGIVDGLIDSIVSVSDNIIILGIINATISDNDSMTITYARTAGSFDDVSGNSLLNFTKGVRNNLNTPPVITLIGANPQTTYLGAGYTELYATTNDGSTVTIDATEFTDTIGTYSIYYDSTDELDNKAVQVIRTVNVVEGNIPTSCIPPVSGDWIITENCTINSSVTARENVIVQNDSVLTIPSGITLDIDYATFNLTVQSGSGVLIKSGGTLT